MTAIRVMEVGKPIVGRSDEDVRRSMALDAFVRLKEAGMLANPDANPDTPLPEAYAAHLSKRLGLDGQPNAPKTWGEAVLAFSGDADRDGLGDLNLSGLREMGLVRPGTSTAQMEATLTGPAPTADKYEAATRGAANPFAGVDKTLAPVGATQAQNTLDVRAVEMRKPSANPETGYMEAPVKLVQGADGIIKPFNGSIPDGANVYTAATVEAGSDGTAYLSLFNAKGSDSRFVKVSGSGKTNDPSLPPEQARAIIGDVFKQAYPNPTGENRLTQLAKVHDQQQKLVDGPEPSDPALRTVYRAAKANGPELEQKMDALELEHGVRPKRWHGWVDDVRETSVVKAVQDAALPNKGITPSFLYTVAMGEGLNFYVDSNYKPSGVDVKQPVNGFEMLGVDTFGTRVGYLKAKGYIKPDFKEGKDYTLETNTNELNQKVTSANFPDLKSGMTALSGMLADSRDLFLRDAKAILGPAKAAKMTETQINYFNYLYFNAGPGQGKKYLQQHGLAFSGKWTGPAPADNRVAKFNAAQRIATWKLIDGLQLFK